MSTRRDRKKKKRTEAFTKHLTIQNFLLALFALAVLAGAGWVVREKVWGGPAFEQTQVNLLFVRQRDDGAGAVNPCDIVSVTDKTHAMGGVRLCDVFSKEGKVRYGGFASNTTYGAGLDVTLVTKIGTRVSGTASLSLPGWKVKEETLNPDRRRLVDDKAVAFDAMVKSFAGRVNVDLVRVMALDVTDGVSPRLLTRVRDLLAADHDLCNEGPVTLIAYHITDRASQTERLDIELCAPQGVADAESWLVKGQRAVGQSSVFGGLWAVWHDLSLYATAHPNALIVGDFVTDALENTDEVSFYKNPRLVDDHQAVNDAINTRGVDLHGVAVRFYPLDETNAHYKMTMKLFGILADRLTADAVGATVEVNSR